jgi:hypothetical protein
VGRLTGLIAVGAVVLAAVLAVVAPAPARAGGGFADLTADATFGVDMTFGATWSGAAPDRYEILLGFGGEDRLVVPVSAAGSDLTYRRDLADEYLPPNTVVTYQWRATDGANVTLSPERTLLYDDDRSQLNWEQAAIGSATVHWYGDNEAIARRFGDLAGTAADAAADLLGAPLADGIDIFVYDAREDFIGAVGPSAREWVGAATYPNIRTVFMWLQAGGTDYLELTIRHEVTHVVFYDATHNPFHAPPTWMDEGTATWSEDRNVDTERDLVSRESKSAQGLMAFEALTDQFPIDARDASLAYAEGTVMIDQIIHDHGAEAMAAIAEAYRTGATDDEAIQAGTGESFADLRSEFFDSFGVSEPDPVEPLPLEGSDVSLPGSGSGHGSGNGSSNGSDGAGSSELAWILIIAFIVVGVLFVAAVLIRARRQPAPPPAAPPMPPPAAPEPAAPPADPKDGEPS